MNTSCPNWLFDSLLPASTLVLIRLEHHLATIYAAIRKVAGDRLMPASTLRGTQSSASSTRVRATAVFEMWRQ